MQCIVQLGRRAGCTALGNRRGQSGVTLIEILISVALVAMVVLGLATGFLTLIRTNAATNRQQQVDHAATNYAESLKAVRYQPCVPAGVDPDYAAAPEVWAPAGELQVQVVDVEFWDPTERDFVDDCTGADAGTQRVTVRAELRDRERQAQIVKRNR